MLLMEELTDNEELRGWVMDFSLDRLEEGQDWDIRSALLAFSKEIFKEELVFKTEIAIEIAVEIDAIIRSIVYEDDILIIDWQNKTDIEGKIKIAIDDYIFDLKAKYDLEISFKQIDDLVEQGLNIAKIKFV